MNLDVLRAGIDEIDIQLQELFEKRMALCDEVAREKQRTNAPVLQSGREEQILLRVRERSAPGFADSSEELFRDIMSISRGRQKKLLSSAVEIPRGSEVNIIITCGGSSQRMGFNKLLYPLGDKPVILHTLERLDGLENVSRIILSVGKSFLKEIDELISGKSFNTDIVAVVGGETRQQSVANALSAVTDGCCWLCIHDGARPFVKRQTVYGCLEGAKETGAAVACVAVKDTVKTAKNGKVVQTPERDTLFAAQTPQVLSLPLYKTALDSAMSAGRICTDDVSLCESIGVMPKITPGDYSNIKLTTEEDIRLAKMLMEGRDEKC